MFRLLGDLIAPAGKRGRLIVLIYHRVLAEPDPILYDETDAGMFERQMALLAAEFNVLPLSEACARLRRGSLPARAVCVTFDDGYADNEQIALPILRRLGLRATFFVSTGFSGGAVMFNDAIIDAMRRAPVGHHDLSRLGFGEIEISDDGSRRAAVDRLIGALKYRPLAERQVLVEKVALTVGSPSMRNLMMTPSQISKVHKEGMDIGAHTVNHPILKSISEGEARTEIVTSKRTLEEITEAPVTLFAYPNGKPGTDYGPEHVRLVKEAGFEAAVSTMPGVACRDSDVFQLPRLGAWDRNPRRMGLRLLMSLARPPAAPRASLQPMGS